MLGKVRPCLPVALVEGVLNADNRIFFDVPEVEVRKLCARDPLGRIRVRVLEVEIVLPILVELGRSNVERDFDLALVSSLLDRLRE